jgi:hypothetical protein
MKYVLYDENHINICESRSYHLILITKMHLEKTLNKEYYYKVEFEQDEII